MASVEKNKPLHSYEDKIIVGDFELPFLLKKGGALNDALVVMFAGFAPEGSKIRYPYNYFKSLQEFEANLLFIADSYGPRGCYYLGKELMFDFEPIVVDLIEKVRSELGVEKEHVICAGSSKGGSAALYYAMKYGYGSVLAGAPQTRIATYMLEDPTTFKFMFGENCPQSMEAGDGLLFDLIGRSQTHITIVASPRDYQYSDHIEPFIAELEKNERQYHLIIDGSATNHNDIGIYFKRHLPRLILDIINARRKKRIEQHLGDILKPLAETRSGQYNFALKTLCLTPEERYYLVLFDGDFDKPAESPKNKRHSRMIIGHSRMTLSMEVGISETITITFFIMQYQPDGRVNKTNKLFELNPSANGNLVECDLTVPINPAAESYKVAIRFFSKNGTTVVIQNPRVMFT